MIVTVPDLIAVLIAFQSFLFSMFLWSQRRDRALGQRLLAVFSLLLGLHFLNIFLIETRLLLLNLSSCFAVFYAPLLYFYVRAILDPGLQMRGRHLAHILPLFLSLAWTVQDYRNKVAGFQPNSWITLPILLQMAVYLAFSLRHFRHYGAIVVHTRSTLGFLRQRLLKFFMIMFLILMAGVAVELAVGALGRYGLQSAAVIVIFIDVLVLISGFMFMGLRHPHLFRAFEDSEVEVARENRLKYRTSSLTAEESDRYLATLRSTMTARKPHLDPNLKLSDLARQARVPMRYLSQIINQRIGMNFFDFVNSYRIEEVKAKMAANTRHQTSVLELMLDAGFNSKSSFNKAFKRHTGTTPSFYRDKFDTGKES